MYFLLLRWYIENLGQGRWEDNKIRKSALEKRQGKLEERIKTSVRFGGDLLHSNPVTQLISNRARI